MEALAAARESEYDHYLVQTLSSIATALMKAGMTTEARETATEVRETATKALAVAREITRANFRSMLLSSIAWALVETGMVMDGLAVAREIDDVDYRASALHSIAVTLMKTGMLMEAVAVAREIKVAYHRANALMTVVDFWLERRQDDEARNSLEEAQDAVSKVFDDQQRSEVMWRLAVILARLHSYRAAREATEQCSSSEDRLTAYTAILREYHIERDPGLARLFAEEKEEEEED
jgi:hypothetical protein